MKRAEQFEHDSGSIIERLVFSHRIVLVLAGLTVTAIFAFQAMQLQLNASFAKAIPTAHPFVVNYLRHGHDLAGVNNAVRIAVYTTRGTVFDGAYLETLKKINDEVLLIPGVDRPYMKSLWTPSTRWMAVTEEGFEGGPVMSDDYDGSPRAIAQVRANVERSGEIGQLVAANYRSTVLFVPLLERDPISGAALDYKQFADALEQVRTKYQTNDIEVHITGFAKIIGDMIDGLTVLLSFFGMTVVISMTVLYWYSRSLRATVLVTACSLLAVVWLLGLLSALDQPLDPYSTLVPFLLLASGMSHGAQMLNGFMQEAGGGNRPLMAARYCFRRLFPAGLAALLTDLAAYAALMIIPIPGIRELALAAIFGVTALIFTNLMLLPVLLTYIGVDRRSAVRSLEASPSEIRIWRWFEPCARRRGAYVVVGCAGVLTAISFFANRNLVVGDLDSGATELRAESRYNRDNAFMNANYAASSDLLVIMVTTPRFQCTSYGTLDRMDALAWQLGHLPGVISTRSFAALSRGAAVSMNEGYLKWYELPRNQATLNMFSGFAPPGMLNQGCDLLPLHVYLKDHRADTVERVVENVREFAARNNTDSVQFQLAAGNAGMAAAANDVVKQASVPMVGLGYISVLALSFIGLRSWRAVACAALPLVLTAALCQALMVRLGMGIKVSTLPVIVLSIGVGIDYALYMLSVVVAHMREGMDFSQAYLRALFSTGRIVVLMGVTLSVAVATWALSPIRFQADMGVLLAFAFAVNMLGALILVPALAHFLLPDNNNLKPEQH